MCWAMARVRWDAARVRLDIVAARLASMEKDIVWLGAPGARESARCLAFASKPQTGVNRASVPFRQLFWFLCRPTSPWPTLAAARIQPGSPKHAHICPHVPRNSDPSHRGDTAGAFRTSRHHQVRRPSRRHPRTLARCRVGRPSAWKT